MLCNELFELMNTCLLVQNYSILTYTGHDSRNCLQYIILLCYANILGSYINIRSCFTFQFVFHFFLKINCYSLSETFN